MDGLLERVLAFGNSGTREPLSVGSAGLLVRLHILLMLFTSGAGRSDGVSLFPPSAARSAPILLMASLAEFRRASVSEPAEPHTSEVPEPLAQIQESPASIAPTIMQEVPKETRPPDRHGAANSSGSPESSARAEAVPTAARHAASAEQARADEDAARLARHASYGWPACWMCRRCPCQTFNRSIRSRPGINRGRSSCDSSSAPAAMWMNFSSSVHCRAVFSRRRH
jgi:hypothetical protein